MTIHIDAQPGEIAQTVLSARGPSARKMGGGDLFGKGKMRQPSARHAGLYGALARQPCDHSRIWHGHAEPLHLRQ